MTSKHCAYRDLILIDGGRPVFADDVLMKRFAVLDGDRAGRHQNACSHSRGNRRGRIALRKHRP
jgi:hypothetical protein